jgi:hypothetical protein
VEPVQSASSSPAPIACTSRYVSQAQGAHSAPQVAGSRHLHGCALGDCRCVGAASSFHATQARAGAPRSHRAACTPARACTLAAMPLCSARLQRVDGVYGRAIALHQMRDCGEDQTLTREHVLVTIALRIASSTEPWKCGPGVWLLKSSPQSSWRRLVLRERLRTLVRTSQVDRSRSPCCARWCHSLPRAKGRPFAA